VPEPSTTDEPELPAGDFSTWLRGIEGALRGEHGSDVPCNGCTACCRSSQFVAIAPDEVRTLARIPTELLFPAPRRPPGHMVLGYDERGHCPMLVDDRCSIYEDRPRACRTYDCRVLPAAGVEPGGEEKAPIVRRVRRWRFSHPTGRDRVEHAAVRAAAAFLDERQNELPAGAVPPTDTARAVLAIAIHELFVEQDEETGRVAIVQPDAAAVVVAVTRRSTPPDHSAVVS
jgi:Fe-S-cluster containining protein